MGLPVVMHDINADWEGWSPKLYLEQIDLLNSAGTEPILHFKRASISIDFLKSLVNRQIIPRQLMISGFNITVTRLENGAIDIAGIHVQDASEPARPVRDNELADWLLGQNSIELQNANLSWIDQFHSQPPVNLSNVNLTLRSDGNRLQLQGASTLPDEFGNGMNFALDVQGDILSSDWSADIYLQANNIIPDNWYKEYWPEQLDVIEGNASLTLWSSWKNSRVSSFNGMLEFSNLNIQSDQNHSLHIHHLSSSFFGSNDADNWIVDVRLDNLLTDHGEWPVSDFAINFDSMDNLTALIVDFSYLNIEDFLSILPSIPGIASSTISEIDSYSLSGKLLNGSIKYDAGAADNQKFYFDFGFSDLQSGQFTFEPESIKVSGRISGSSDKGRVVFNDNTMFIKKNLNSPTLSPIILSGAVDWTASEGLRTLSTDKLQFSNEAFYGGLSGKIISENQNVTLELMFDIDEADIRKMVDYIPFTPGFRTRDWIDRSITAGKIQNFKMIYRGNPKDFPFENSNGQFLAHAQVRDSELSYSHRFPSIQNIDTDLTFKGREMHLAVKQGGVFDANIVNASAIIPNIFKEQKILDIDGLIRGNLTDLKTFISNSPLVSDEMLAKANDSLISSGDFSLHLGLKIPLKTPDKLIEVQGQLTVDNAGIKSDLRNLELSSVNGIVNFTESSITTDKLNAKLNGQDVKLYINGNKNNDDLPAVVSISGKANSEFLSRKLTDYYPALSHFTETLKDRVSGSTNWTASIHYQTDSSHKGLNRTINISTDLIGLTIDLPAPFGKIHYEKVPLVLNRLLDAESDNILNLKYGEIDASLRFDKFQQNKINNLSMLISMPYAEHSIKDGINIIGRLKELNLDEWQNLLSDSQNRASQMDQKQYPLNANLIINNLQFLGQTFTELDLSARSVDNNFNVQLESEEVSGTIEINTGSQDSKSINVEFNTLSLKNTGGIEKAAINPAKLPSIQANITDFKYNDMNLGNLELTAVPSRSGMSIDNLSFNKPGLSIMANGKWNTNRYTVYSSSFTIEAQADEFSNLIGTFGFNSDVIVKAKTSLSVDANWSGSPMDFSLDKLNGTINMDMGKGQIRDINPAAGRLFGLLSLQTLPRRLVLDFSDIFGSGMAFDRISGSFDVSEGNAYTENLSMKGPSVDIEVSGRIGLAEEDYDQIAIITPQISDSLAVASGFLGPVGMGVGTVLYLAGNMFEPLSNSINKIMKVEYTIEGQWDDPVIKKIGVEKGP
jgi:uncharacterized protein (TIGR02099 family)